MVPLVVILVIIAFITADVVIRIVMQRMQEAKVKQERMEALDKGLKLDFADEAKTLKRVEVDEPKAKILAVDDEEIILDSFRKILVLAGFSVDTVERGSEALTLIQKNEYDFVFTDLKMPEMDGVEVAKAVKHLRPDIDVIVITGYATIETAVETMKYGAMDYVQKPFTEDELVEFVNKSYIKRQDRLERQVKPKIHLVTPSSGQSTSKHEFNVPAGIFISRNHTWVNVGLDGMARVGVDDFAQKILGKIDEVELPKEGQDVKKGDLLFKIKQGEQSVQFLAPIAGKVSTINEDLLTQTIEVIKTKPYELGWVCGIEPTNLSSDMQSLKIGAEAISWYQGEVDKYMEIVKDITNQDELWQAFSKSFFTQKDKA